MASSSETTRQPDPHVSKTLAACIVRVCNEDGQTFGTGFVIGAGRVITCAHVVESVGGKPGERAFILFAQGGEKRPVLVDRATWRGPDEEDIAVLEFKGRLPSGVRPARVTTSRGSKDSTVESFGYPKVGEVEGVWAQGRMAGETTEKGIRLLQLDSKVITAGFSGAPVWRVDTGQAIGMVTSFVPATGAAVPRDVAYAVPSELLPGVKLERLRARLPVWMIGVSTSVVVGLIVIISLYLLLVFRPPPTATAPPLTTAAPTFIPTPLPTLEVFNPSALQNTAIRDVAAAEGHVWFGTDKGLFHYYEPGNADPVLVAPDVSISALAVESAGRTVWFSRTTAAPIPPNEGLVGRYILPAEGEPARPVEWWTPENGPFEIVSVQVGELGDVWMGGQNGEVFRLSLTDVDDQPTWTPFPLQSGLYDLSLDPRDDSIVWVAGSTAAYELRESRWTPHGQNDLGVDPQATVMNAVAMDDDGRAWIGHASGLILFWNRQPGGKMVVPCSLETVFDAAAASDTDALWFVTRNNLERLDLTSDLDACETWELVSWTDNLFWSGGTPVDYRLAIDKQTPTSAVTIWVIRRGTDQVRVLRWR